MVQRKKVKVDLQHYRQRLADFAEQHQGTDVGGYATKQLGQKIVVVEATYYDDQAKAVVTRQGVVMSGQRFSSKHDRKVCVLIDGKSEYVDVRLCNLVYLANGPRGIYWPAGIFVGGTGHIMGAIAKGIRSGRTFRGR